MFRCVVGHANGLTLGPRLGDAPFAVIHAEGAKGAKIFNGNGATIDGYGNAIMPSMTPYRENSVAIDYKDLPSSVDVLENQKTVVPRAGPLPALRRPLALHSRRRRPPPDSNSSRPARAH